MELFHLKFIVHLKIVFFIQNGKDSLTKTSYLNRGEKKLDVNQQDAGIQKSRTWIIGSSVAVRTSKTLKKPKMELVTNAGIKDWRKSLLVFITP